MLLLSSADPELELRRMGLRVDDAQNFVDNNMFALLNRVNQNLLNTLYYGFHETKYHLYHGLVTGLYRACAIVTIMICLVIIIG